MSLATVHGVVIDGVRGVMVRVEVAVCDGLPSVGVVGLPDASVAESRWRARCAVEASGQVWPNRRITVSLSPAEVRKHGAGLDLPMAVGVLVGASALPHQRLSTTAFIGELGLDGRLRRSAGLLAAVLAARAAGLAAVVVPAEGTADLASVPGIAVTRAVDLSQVCGFLAGCEQAMPGHLEVEEVAAGSVVGGQQIDPPDLRDVRGHDLPRWALEVAAAGGHHLALIGPPGVGKTLLAQRLPGILPPLTEDRSLEVASIHSVSGLPRASPLLADPPFAAPHHSASAAALLGSVRGGRVTPGSVTLAHHGVLFLDEAPEFARPALEGLRQPLESGEVSLARTGWSGTLPARFQLVLAANPCPCGLRIGTGAGCSCSPAAVRRYATRLSGPLMDRIDIRLPVGRPAQVELESTAAPEASEQVRDRIRSARDRMARRFADRSWLLNAEMPAGELRRTWSPTPEGATMLGDFERRSGNLRGVDRVLRLSWTLADLRGVDRPDRDDVAGALALRGAHLGWST